MSALQKEKGIRFFEYLLELNNLVGKVDRDYKVYEKAWQKKTFDELDGCRVLSECVDEGNFLEIQKPKITQRDEKAPVPPGEIQKWIKGTYTNENLEPVYHGERMEKNKEGEEIVVSFEDDSTREKLYKQWKEEWKEWSERLKEKKRVRDLYNQFFHLVSRFDQEGDTLEFIFGRGILTWQHPDRKIGTIRHPLITSRLELELVPQKSLIVAKKLQEQVNVERDMLSGVNLPNKQQLDDVVENITSREILDDFSDLFKQYASLIHPDGTYLEENEKQTINKKPVLYEQSVFTLRSKKVRVLREDLEQIITGVEHGTVEIPEAVSSIFEEKGESETQSSSSEEGQNPLPNNHLYFPLPANEQQKEIVNRIDRSYGVTVQGPPGTGKTHTIANLVSHFLSQGKRILITSQKENALKVLKDKIPDAIRDLCVPVLGGGRESLAEIESSIRTLSEKLGELDEDTLQKTIDRNLDALDRSKREEARLINELKTYTEKEGTPLIYKGEKRFKYDVAKELAQTDIPYQWIRDEVPMDAEFPLDQQQWTKLWSLRDRIEKKDLSLKGKRLPEIEKEILSNQSFENLVQEEEFLNEYEEEGSQVIQFYQLPKNLRTIQAIKEKLEEILLFEDHIKQEFSQLIIKELRAGDIREERWRKLLDEQQTNVHHLFSLYNDLIVHDIQLPDKDLRTIEEDVQTVKNLLEEGKKADFLFFLFKGRNTKYLFEENVLNGKPIERIEDLEPIEKHIEYQKKKKETARILNGNMQEVKGNTVDVDSARFPHDAENTLKNLQKIINYVDGIENMVNQFDTSITSEIDHYDFKVIERMQREMDIAEKYIQLEQWKNKQENEINRLRNYSKEENMHPMIYDFMEAMENKDVDKWKELTAKVLQFKEVKQLVDQLYELLDAIGEQLPATAASIEASVGEEWSYIHNYQEALEMRKLQTWLDETKDVNVARLKDKLEEEHNEQKRVIYEVVTASTWKSQLKRVTQQQKRALSSWKTYIKRYGKGSGKSAQTNLKGARESMKTAQGAIPVWIMPVNQVMENFPVTNEKFDVIIFDESSQCDLFSTNVLLRGKKMIVVGDEEQISPQAIGTKLDDVNELVRRYLSDVPNANLFDGNISLYEIAEQTFPKEGKLMLREHFRCVPEIIQFSNDLSYGGEMIPLRLPLEEEKLDPPVQAIKVLDGYNDAREKDINVPEAERIVEEIVSMSKNPKYEDQTFGVIALQGQKQAAYIEGKIREALGDEEFVRRKLICGDAYTLQGDERDVIFLSMVVAPERNFRALTKNSEKQRINVAASRAKNQMRLYHSVDVEDLNPSDLRYRLLSYCKDPSRVNDEMENLEEKCDSPFEVDVLRMILDKGYKVTPQVKVGRYRIDLVVEGIRNRLAVECDGEAWHGPEKFEEDMQRQESLERAGWNFWRIRGREFYLNRKNALESLWKKLEEMDIHPAYPSEVIEEESIHQSVESDLPLTELLEKGGLEVIDKREKEGNLWVKGGKELEPFMNVLHEKGVHFVFTPKGSRSTDREPGWYMKDYYR
ncbi:AAA domain-containing protein [Halobacillus yeomjeoni]|uniref:AAA family ATPase n=1 Tax=Halobacillus yeomjeoni TaxID=311194 RepID=A0A931MW51_9BACI|nr:AAA domain-containing protein [Halobacillus yeomjeoni]MBH0231387.1 AAA family ATPase [Halobacillus yeomjeoni]